MIAFLFSGFSKASSDAENLIKFSHSVPEKKEVLNSGEESVETTNSKSNTLSVKQRKLSKANSGNFRSSTDANTAAEVTTTSTVLSRPETWGEVSLEVQHAADSVKERKNGVQNKMMNKQRPSQTKSQNHKQKSSAVRKTSPMSSMYDNNDVNHLTEINGVAVVREMISYHHQPEEAALDKHNKQYDQIKSRERNRSRNSASISQSDKEQNSPKGSFCKQNSPDVSLNGPSDTDAKKTNLAADQQTVQETKAEVSFRRFSNYDY